MRVALAERLLAAVMRWDPQDVARERPLLQTMAGLKYDSYQQFSPGMRFLESLALWLDQFGSKQEKEVALAFVKKRLVFLSAPEMEHFATMAYPDHIRPYLLSEAAKEERIPSFLLRTALESPSFTRLEKSALFFGLSDGARVDFFRRSNRGFLSHEQIFQGYDLSAEKLKEVKARLLKIGGDPPCSALVLLDDFTASGTSYLREDGGPKGKIATFLTRVRDESVWRELVRLPDTKIVVAVYVATAKAIENIQTRADRLLGANASGFRVEVVQRLEPDMCVTDDDPFAKLAEDYYDAEHEDEHTRKGGTDLRFGFADGRLPLVLAHNSPNNSLFLLWAEEPSSVRALFPRISRHGSRA